MTDAATRLGKALLLAARNFSADGCFNHCAAISYYALLSVVPALSLIASIVGSLSGSSEAGLAATMERFNNVIPGLGEDLTTAAQSFLGNTSTIGLASGVVTLWLATLVFFAVQTAVGQILRRPVESFSWRRLALDAAWDWGKPFLMFLSAATLLIAAFVGAHLLTVLRAAAPDAAGNVITWFEALPSVPYVGSLLFSIAMFAVVIQVLVGRVALRAVLLPTAVIGGSGWELAKVVISRYLDYASSVVSFTGSAAAVVIFMFWIYYAAAVLLYSVQLAAVLSGRRH